MHLMLPLLVLLCAALLLPLDLPLLLLLVPATPLQAPIPTQSAIDPLSTPAPAHYPHHPSHRSPRWLPPTRPASLSNPIHRAAAHHTTRCGRTHSALPSHHPSRAAASNRTATPRPATASTPIRPGRAAPHVLRRAVRARRLPPAGAPRAAPTAAATAAAAACTAAPEDPSRLRPAAGLQHTLHMVRAAASIAAATAAAAAATTAAALAAR